MAIPSRMSFYDAATGTFDQAGFDAALAAAQGNQGMLTGPSEPAAQDRYRDAVRSETPQWDGTDAQAEEMYNAHPRMQQLFPTLEDYKSYLQGYTDHLGKQDAAYQSFKEGIENLTAGDVTSTPADPNFNWQTDYTGPQGIDAIRDALAGVQAPDAYSMEAAFGPTGGTYNSFVEEQGLSPDQLTGFREGDKYYAWNGVTFEERDVSEGLVGQAVKAAIVVGSSLALGPSLSAALTPALGATGAAAASAAIISAGQQLALTGGDLDLTQVLQSAAMAGLSTEAINQLNGYLNEPVYLDANGNTVSAEQFNQDPSGITTVSRGEQLFGDITDTINSALDSVMGPDGESFFVDGQRIPTESIDELFATQEGKDFLNSVVTGDVAGWTFENVQRTGFDLSFLPQNVQDVVSNAGEAVVQGTNAIADIIVQPANGGGGLGSGEGGSLVIGAGGSGTAQQQPEEQPEQQPQQQPEEDVVTPEELAGNQDIFGDTTQEDTASIVDSLLGEYTTPIRDDIQRQQEAIDNLVDQVANSPVPPTAQEVASYLQENGVPLDQATLTDIQNRINEATANQVTQEQVTEAISGAGLASSAEVDALGESLAADIAANGTLTEANAEAIGELGLTVDEFITQYGADVVGLNEAIAATDQNVIDLASTVETGFADVNTKIDDLSTGVQEELETIAGQITANGEVSAENQARLDELGVTLGDISAEFGDQYASLSDIVSSGLEEAEAQRQELAESIAANGELTEANLEAITSLGTNLDDFVAQYATDVEGLSEAVAATDESVLSLAETTQAGFEAAQEEREALASALDAVGGDVTALDEATQQRFEDLGVTVSDLATEFGDQFANLESSVAEDITGLETAFGEQLTGLETAFGEDIGALEETVTTGFGQAADARAALAESLSGKLAEQAEGFNTALTTAEANLLSEITGVESSVLEELSTQTGALEELITNQGTTFEKAQEDINNYLADFALQTEQGFGQAAEERGALQEGLLGLGTALGLGLTGLETQFGQGLTELGSELGGQISGVQEELLSGLSEAELGRRQLASRINQREFKPAPIPQLSYQPLQLEGLIQGPQRDYVNELNQIINRSLFEGMI